MLFAAVCTFAAPARAEWSAVGDDGFASRHVAMAQSTPEQSWDALIDVSKWWNGAHSFSGDAQNLTLDPRAGGCFCEMLPITADRKAPGSVRHMEVIFVDPGRAMRLTGALGPLQSEPVGAVLTITLKQEDGGTRILFEYVVGGTMRFPRDRIAPAVDSVIGEQLSRLVEVLGPLPQKPREVPLPPSTATPAEEVGQAPSTDTQLGDDFLSDLDSGDESAVNNSSSDGDLANEEPPAVDEEPLDEFDTR